MEVCASFAGDDEKGSLGVALSARKPLIHFLPCVGLCSLEGYSFYASNSYSSSLIVMMPPKCRKLVMLAICFFLA